MNVHLRARFDPAAIASDVPRSCGQAVRRGLARVLVRAFRLNCGGALSTEFAQLIAPVVTVPTRSGPLYVRAGHGRLRWRAQTFHTEEPDTVAWLDTLGPADVLWDVGANVGLYAIYAAKFRRCQVVAVEPESQNYAVLVQNIVLNGVGDRCCPTNVALAHASGLGRLRVPYLTQGGAYNTFVGLGRADRPLPESVEAVRDPHHTPIEQLVAGFALDDLVEWYGLPAPTHLKIDVDGLEPDIVEGAARTLASVRGVLIEINRKSLRDRGLADTLRAHGLRLVSERSAWLSRVDRRREAEVPTANLIFVRDSTALADVPAMIVRAPWTSSAGHRWSP